MLVLSKMGCEVDDENTFGRLVCCGSTHLATNDDSHKMPSPGAGIIRVAYHAHAYARVEIIAEIIEKPE
jgi:hypothetical protein